MVPLGFEPEEVPSSTPTSTPTRTPTPSRYFINSLLLDLSFLALGNSELEKAYAFSRYTEF